MKVEWDQNWETAKHDTIYDVGTFSGSGSGDGPGSATNDHDLVLLLRVRQSLTDTTVCITHFSDWDERNLLPTVFTKH